MQEALSLVFNLGLYVGDNEPKTLKDVIDYTYLLLSDFSCNVFVQVDNNEPNDLDAIKDDDYYANYIVTGSYVDRLSDVVIYAISQEDYKNGCKK